MTFELPKPPELKFTLQYNEALITEYGQACFQAGMAAALEDAAKKVEEVHEFYGVAPAETIRCMK